MATAITPAATTSKILIMADFNVGRDSNDGNSQVGIQLLRGTTLIGNADASSSRTPVACITDVLDNDVLEHMSLNHIDSPSTTSAITYTFQVNSTQNSSQTFYYNRTVNDTDAIDFERGLSWITAMEVTP